MVFSDPRPEEEKSNPRQRPFLCRGRAFIEETVPWDGSLLGYLSTFRFIPWHLKLWKLRMGTEEGMLPNSCLVWKWRASTKAELQPSLGSHTARTMVELSSVTPQGCLSVTVLFVSETPQISNPS